MTPYLASILAHRRLAAKTFELTLVKPAGFYFKPGQRIEVATDCGVREYSLACAPADDHLKLCIRKVRDGAVSNLLAGMKIGQKLSFSGPSGQFLFRPSDRCPVFVATGTGVAPFYAMARAEAAGFYLIHGVRHPQELYYRDELAPKAAHYHPCVTSSKAISGAFTGRVTTWLGEFLAPGDYDFYLSGNREMIRDATALIDKRFAGARLYLEPYF